MHPVGPRKDRAPGRRLPQRQWMSPFVMMAAWRAGVAAGQSEAAAVPPEVLVELDAPKPQEGGQQEPGRNLRPMRADQVEHREPPTRTSRDRMKCDRRSWQTLWAQYDPDVGETVSIFLVEDDAALTRAFARVVRPFGAVVNAHTVKDAFRVLEQPTSFAALLVDVRLPDGSGLDVLEAARSKPWLAHASALVMTGHMDETTTHRALALDAHFLAKPFEIGQLNAYLHGVVGKQGSAASRRNAVVVRWTAFYGLTERQTQLLTEAVAGGASRQEIAERWGVSLETIKKCAHELLAKTGDESLSGAVARVLRESAEI
jgi:FixJ family two-component response regulator